MRKKGMRRRSERGYALISLLAALTLALIAMSAALPQIKFEAQREREAEMFWRGQQISIALQQYARRTGGRLPMKLADLVEPVEIQGKRLRFLRPSALCDPMKPCPAGESNWHEIRRGDPLIRTFAMAYEAERQRRLLRGEKPGLPELPPEIKQLVQASPSRTVKLPGASDEEANGENDQTEGGPRDTEFNSSLRTETGPIYGVASKNKEFLIRKYLDLQTYNEAAFITGVTVTAPGFVNPYVVYGVPAATPAGRQVDPRCPNWGMYFEQNGKGYCGGVISPGQLCRDGNGNTIPCPPGKK